MDTKIKTSPELAPLNGALLMGFTTREDGTYNVCVLWRSEPVPEYCVAHVQTLDDPEWSDGIYIRTTLHDAYRVMINLTR